MNFLIDILGLALIFLNVVLGLRYGLLRRLFVIAGLYAGLAVASFVGNAVVGWFYGTGKPSALYADAWTFLAVVAIVVGAAELLGALYSDRLRSIATLMFDRSTAVGVGAVLGLLEVAVVCMVGLSTGDVRDPGDGSLALPSDRSSIADSVRASVIGGRVNGLQSTLDGMFRPVLPQDLSAHLADSTRLDQSQRAAR